MQKYGKTLKADRFSPIFYTFAEEFNKYMKYLKAIFTLSANGNDAIGDAVKLQASKDVLCEVLGEVCFESFEYEGNTVTGYIQEGAFDKSAVDSCVKFFPINDIDISYIIEDVEDKNWNETWETYGFEPIVIEGKCVIHDTIHSPLFVQDGIIDITIDAKQAFGTGGHETTFMIVNDLFDADLNGKHVLDCGCGTGILSIVSAKLGAAEITAYDIDEWSVENTRHNCSLNNVGSVNVMHGDAGLLLHVAQRFDVVLANINRNILLADMAAFRKIMADKAVLVLSGFYGQDADMLIDKAQSLKLALVHKETRNNWCMLKFEALGRCDNYEQTGFSV